ncbi:serine hydrolase [Mesorhizobium sp. LHD-90]|uniref:serine hydrolase domain-containing protein n=1 Tax=Mesorhizobium sp. LHD-90 TaxID=3071414 RepID=UPI0027DF3EC9|nr:serine hydrolase [Mesorhizobium sp. LHD-90]MDQ6436772.1 serine hydrolase [Mesorhizobium sp. LHD-90]
MKRRTLLASAATFFVPIGAGAQESAPLPRADAAAEAPRTIGAILDRGEELESLKAFIVARDGKIVAERAYRPNALTASTNIKSASKSVISALVGIAIGKGMLSGPEQKIAPLLSGALPDDPDPRLAEITVGNLLSMQSGLARTSGPNYGRWVASRNWVRFVLEQPFEDEPGGAMLYSTGSTHLLSAILTRLGGRPTRDLAKEWLAPVEGFSIGGWDRDPQGIYLGGNQMAMSPRSLLAFGELYRNGGRTAGGARVVAAEWIDASWQVRTHSRFSGDGYGYGWFIRRIGGEQVYYAWGYGGQMLYIVPALGLTVVMVSDEDNPSARTGYRDLLHGLLGDVIALARDRSVQDMAEPRSGGG